MAQAKIATRGKKGGSNALEAEERWAVIGTAENKSHPNRSIYLESPEGIDREEAEKLASRLLEARAVPRTTLDRFGRLDQVLYQEWQEANEG